MSSDNDANQLKAELDANTLNGKLNIIAEQQFLKLKEEIQNNTGVYCHNNGHIKTCGDNISKIINWQNSIINPEEKIAAQIRTGLMIVHDDVLDVDFVLISAGALNDIIKVGVRSSFNGRLSRLGFDNVDIATSERIKSLTYLDKYRALKRRWTVKDGTRFFAKHFAKKEEKYLIPKQFQKEINDIFDEIKCFSEFYNEISALDEFIVNDIKSINHE